MPGFLVNGDEFLGEVPSAAHNGGSASRVHCDHVDLQDGGMAPGGAAVSIKDAEARAPSNLVPATS